MKPHIKMAGLLIGMIQVSVSAEVVTSVASNTINQNWSLPATWSDGLAPTAGKSYAIVSTFTVRTPESAGDFVFPGDELRVESGGILALKARQTASVNLIGAGGTISHFSNGQTPDLIRLAGDIRIETGLTINTGQASRTIELLAPISGPGTFSKISPGVLILAADNSFGSGTFTHGSGTTNRGHIRLAHPSAFGNHELVDLVATGAGVSGIELSGGVDVDLDLRSTPRDNPETAGYLLRSVSGNNRWSGDISLAGAGGAYAIVSDAGSELVLAGTVSSAVETGETWQTLLLAGSGSLVIEGGIVKGGDLPSQDLGVTRTGGGQLTLLGTSNYGGPTRVTAGSLVVGSPTAIPATSAVEVSGQGSVLAVPFGGPGAFTGAQIEDLLDRSLFTGIGAAFGVDTSGAIAPVLYDGAYASGAAFAKLGEGVLRINSSYNHDGDLICGGGVVRLEGPDILTPTSAVTMAYSGDLELGVHSQSIDALRTPPLGATDSAITGSGALDVTGPLNLEIGPGGTQFGGGAVVVTSSSRVALDLSGLASFSKSNTGGIFRVGLKAGSNNSGALGEIARAVLADTNVIRGSLIAVGDVAANNSGGTAVLQLGRQNTFNTPTLNIGFSGRSRATLEFAPGLVEPKLVLRGTDGVSATNLWRVGNVATFDVTTWTDTVDLSSGELDAVVNTMEIGNALIGTQTNRAGIQNSTFRMGDGILRAGTVLVGQIAGGEASAAGNTLTANGTFELNHPDGVLDAGSLRLAENTILGGGAGAKSVSGTLRLLSGTIRAGEIRRGSQTGNANASTNFQWTNGTIRNREGVDLTIDALPIVFQPGSHVLEADEGRSVTVNANSPMSGSGELVTRGNGSVVLKAANTRTGDTMVEAGHLRLETATLDPAGIVTIGTGAVLELAYTGENPVGGLVIGGTVMESGTWGANGSGAQHVDDTHFAGTGVLVVPAPLSGYELWAAGFAGGQGPDGDFDGDGIPNLLEYALQTNPDGSDGSLGTLAGGEISFAKRAEAVAAGDVSYVIESSTSLLEGSWMPVTALVDNATTISAAIPAGEGRVFLRLRVTR